MATTEAARTHAVEVTVNGEKRSADIEPRLLLVHFLRETLGLTGTHIGCDTTSCGACTVLVDGVPVKSCTMFAVQVVRKRRDDGRGSTPGRRSSPDPGRLPPRTRPPVRLLHARHDADRRGSSEGEPEPERRGDPLGDLREHLPLHGLPEHRQVGSARSGGNEGVHMSPTRKKGAHGGNMVSPVIENIVKSVQHAAAAMRGGE